MNMAKKIRNTQKIFAPAAGFCAFATSFFLQIMFLVDFVPEYYILENRNYLPLCFPVVFACEKLFPSIVLYHLCIHC